MKVLSQLASPRLPCLPALPQPRTIRSPLLLLPIVLCLPYRAFLPVLLLRLLPRDSLPLRPMSTTLALSLCENPEAARALFESERVTTANRLRPGYPSPAAGSCWAQDGLALSCGACGPPGQGFTILTIPSGRDPDLSERHRGRSLGLC